MKHEQLSKKIKGKRTRYVLLVLALILMLLLLVMTIVGTNLSFFRKYLQESKKNTIEGAAEYAASLIKGDKIDDWLENGRNDDYWNTYDNLYRYFKSTPNLDSITVLRTGPDCGYCIFDVVSSDQSSGKEYKPYVLGEKIEYDSIYLNYLPEFLEGKEIEYAEIVIDDLSYLIKFAPIFDSDGKCVAYVEVLIESNEISNYVRVVFTRLIPLTAVMVVISILIGLQLSYLSRRADVREQKMEESKKMGRLFTQTTMALANAIDAKDNYTRGHSTRVAEYSKRIAELAGKSEQECEEIYYAALLHDVGKIGVPKEIINKDRALLDSEYNEIKKHPATGAAILETITEYPYLSIGAHYHHERYDGKGYPEHLIGNDIPEIARIISVADAYDAMTSNRSYRAPVPQQKVREEIIEGTGTQFDPYFAGLMLHMIDMDPKYEMREKDLVGGPTLSDELVVGKHRSDVSRGIVIKDSIKTITMRVRGNDDFRGHVPNPSLILFDSLDGRYYPDVKDREKLLYFEYCEIGLNGKVNNSGARKIETKVTETHSDELEKGRYRIVCVRVKDHALIRIIEKEKITEHIIALPDSSRFLYIAFSGEYCRIGNMSIVKSDEKAGEGYIPRIASKISYIDGPEGDLPNLEIDGYRAESTAGVSVTDGMEITFHTKSLPTARLVWHCPSLILFYSDNGMINGENYHEYALIRLDGEVWRAMDGSENEQIVDKKNFRGWDDWKQYNKQGYDCTFRFERDGNVVTTFTENAGIVLRNRTEVKIESNEIYASLSGDQVALTNIRIRIPEKKTDK